MNVLTVYAHHDDPRSVNAAIHAQSREMLESMGHTVTDSDLYALDFEPVLRERDFSDRAVSDRFVPSIEIRRALTGGTVPADIANELEKLRDADLVIFQFPLWWASVPAILKGWIDRVLSFAQAADVEALSSRPFLKGKRAMVITTVEAAESTYSPGDQGGLREILVPLTFNTLAYTGMNVLPTFIVYGATPDRPDGWIATQLERLKAHLVLVLTGL